ncbi:MAG: putative ABC transporter permease [Firmicutes bacterium]|nr:putative ABC transporter permease [Bacillota bacterium]
MEALYTVSTYVLIFFIYCFIGWVWETIIRSANARRYVNSGFLTGPWLPIYGCGAVLMLAASYPANGIPALTFVFGGAAATVMELLTGLTMEKLFAVRYWDYTKYPLNVKGYICLPVTLLWGAFSLLLVYVINPPVEAFMFMLPSYVSIPTALILAVLFVADIIHSTKAALAIKASLETLRSCLDVTGKLTLAAEKLGERMSVSNESLIVELDALKREREKLSAALTSKLNRHMTDDERRILGEASELLSEIKKSNAELRERLERLRPRRRSIKSLLSRNPLAISSKYGGLLERLREVSSSDELFIHGDSGEKHGDEK